MSNHHLKSQLNAYEHELRQAEAINHRLNGELSTVYAGARRAQDELEHYNELVRSSLEQAAGKMDTSHARAVETLALQGEIDEQYRKFKQMELANKKIRACNNKKYYDFATYRTVRKIVQGMMDHLDVRLISGSALAKSIEAQHLQSPDYWLTCALISIAAWQRDDRELAEKAVARAVKLDTKNSAVFYMLFNIRMSREEAARQWFNLYRQCPLNGSDQRTFLMLFSLISKTLNETVEAETKGEILSFVDQVIASNASAHGYDEEESINRISGFFNRMRQPEPFSYVMLNQYCTESKELASVLQLAKANSAILEFVLRTANVPPEQKNAYLKEYMDELLAGPSSAEHGVYKEIEYNERVIEFHGDVEKAKRLFEADQQRDTDELNLIDEMISWIYEQKELQVNGQIRLNLFTLTKGLQIKAAERHAEAYQTARKSEFSVRINDYESVLDFRREQEEPEKVDAYFAGKKREALTAVKNWKAYAAFGLAAGSAVFSFNAGYWLNVLTAAGTAYGIYILLANRNTRKRLERQYAESIRSTMHTITGLFAEIRQYEQSLDEYDAYMPRIQSELAKL